MDTSSIGPQPLPLPEGPQPRAVCEQADGRPAASERRRLPEALRSSPVAGYMAALKSRESEGSSGSSGASGSEAPGRISILA